jgi:hypothetical protein
LIILIGLLTAIAAFHERGMFVGNIGPRLVLIDDNYEPHTVNCGFIEKDPSYANELKDSLTIVWYDAPEEVKDARSDIYSFGMIAFRMTTESIQFGQKYDADAGVMAALQQGLRPLFGKDTSPVLRGLIDQCWVADPAKRPTAMQILNEIAENPAAVFPNIDLAQVEEYRRLVTNSLGAERGAWTVIELVDASFEPTVLRQLSKKANMELAAVASFHYALFTVMERDFDAGLAVISQGRFATNPRFLPDFVDCFLIALSIRYRSLDAYVELLRRLRLPGVLELLLRGIGGQLRAGDAFPHAVPSLVFLCRLLACGMVARTRLLTFVAKFTHRQQSARLLYCFFAPEINTDSALCASFAPAINRVSQKYDWFDTVGAFLRKIDSLSPEQLMSGRVFGDAGDDLMTHIRRDDIGVVKARHAHREDVPPELFNPCVLLHAKPTMAMYAAAYGAVRCYQYFSGSSKGTERDVKYATVGHFAIAGNCLPVLRTLIANKGACIGAAHVAATFHRNHLFRHMVHRGAWERAQEDHAGRLPITIAAGANNVDLLSFLIVEGADVNATEGFGFAALHAAAKAGRCQAVEMLLGIDTINPNIADIWGSTPLHMAVDSNRERVVELMVKRKGVEINARNCKGKTPLYIAARAGRRKIVQLFLERGDIEVNLCSKKGVSFWFLIRHFTQLSSQGRQKLCE